MIRMTSDVTRAFSLENKTNSARTFSMLLYTTNRRQFLLVYTLIDHKMVKLIACGST